MVPDTASRSLLIETNKQKWNWSLWCRSAIIKSHIMQHETTKFPFKSNTLAAILDANGQAIIPGSVFKSSAQFVKRRPRGRARFCF